MASGGLEEFKIAVCGGGGVGKSALTVQFIQNVFVAEYDPTIEDSYRKQLKIDEQTCFLEILDTAGQEEYKSLRDQYMRNNDGFMLVYSIIDRKSYEELQEFQDQICRVKDSDTFAGAIFGNKCDLESERLVSKEEASKKAQAAKLLFFEGSAKARKNVDESFTELVRVIRQTKKPKEKKSTGKCSVL